MLVKVDKVEYLKYLMCVYKVVDFKKLCNLVGL